MCRLTFTGIGTVNDGDYFSSQLAYELNILDICTPVITGATSLLLTYKICRRILTSVEQGMPHRARFKRIAYIIVQSAILYTSSLIFLDIFWITFLITGNNAVYQAMTYTNIASMAISVSLTFRLWLLYTKHSCKALAPTLMVGQLIASSDGATNAGHASTLNFYHHTTAIATSQESSQNSAGISEKGEV